MISVIYPTRLELKISTELHTHSNTPKIYIVSIRIPIKLCDLLYNFSTYKYIFSHIIQLKSQKQDYKLSSCVLQKYDPINHSNEFCLTLNFSRLYKTIICLLGNFYIFLFDLIISQIFN